MQTLLIVDFTMLTTKAVFVFSVQKLTLCTYFIVIYQLYYFPTYNLYVMPIFIQYTLEYHAYTIIY